MDMLLKPREIDGFDAEATVEVTQLGPGEGGKTPYLIVKKGTDPNPTCVNPHCPRQHKCKWHIIKREDNGLTPSIAVIPWSQCTMYKPVRKKRH